MSVEIMKADSGMLVVPEIYHVLSLDVYEDMTAIYLGALLDINRLDTTADILRLPLRETLHYGCTSEGEDRFPAFGQSGKYIDLRLDWFYFNGGKSKKRTAWTTHANWLELVKDRQLKPF